MSLTQYELPVLRSRLSQLLYLLNQVHNYDPLVLSQVFNMNFVIYLEIKLFFITNAVYCFVLLVNCVLFFSHF